MSTQNASQDTSATPSKDRPTCPERDTREGTQDDGRTDHDKEASQGEPPHGHISHGTAKFLWDVDPDDLGDDWIAELPNAYERWKTTGDGCQEPVTGWSQ